MPMSLSTSYILSHSNSNTTEWILFKFSVLYYTYIFIADKETKAQKG